MNIFWNSSSAGARGTGRSRRRPLSRWVVQLAEDTLGETGPEVQRWKKQLVMFARSRRSYGSHNWWTPAANIVVYVSHSKLLNPWVVAEFFESLRLVVEKWETFKASICKIQRFHWPVNRGFTTYSAIPVNLTRVHNWVSMLRFKPRQSAGWIACCSLVSMLQFEPRQLLNGKLVAFWANI